MKKLSLILAVLTIISGCKNNAKSKNPKIDSAIVVKPVNKYNSVVSTKENERDISALRVNTCFVSANYGNEFIYVIDELHCLVLNQLCRYNYDSSNHVLEIYSIGDAHENFMGYFKVFSGRGCEKELSKYNLGEGGIEKYILANENNPSFALITVGKNTSGDFQKVNISNTWLYISNLNANPFQLKGLTNTILDLVNNIKNSLQGSDYLYLQTENKVDIIKNIGKENVNASLANKVDDTYNSLISKWEKINSEKSSIENFLNRYQENNVNYSNAIKNVLTYIQLDKDEDEYNKKLDNEILPIVQPQSETN